MFAIVDGFEKEGNPCMIVLNQPKVNNGSFAGIKPAVIIFNKIPKGFSSQVIDLKIVSEPRASTAIRSKDEVSPEAKTEIKKYNHVQVFKVSHEMLHTSMPKSFALSPESSLK
jgi:hypothetical protein